MGVRLIAQISKLVDPTVLVGVTCKFGSEVPRNGRVSRSYTEACVCVCVCTRAPMGVTSLRASPCGSTGPKERPWEDNKGNVVCGNLRYISFPNFWGACPREPCHFALSVVLGNKTSRQGLKPPYCWVPFRNNWRAKPCPLWWEAVKMSHGCDKAE